MIEQNIPLILPLPKRKEIIANIESLFADARAEKFGEFSGRVQILIKRTSWRCCQIKLSELIYRTHL